MDERYRRAAMAGVPVPLVDLRVRGDDGIDQPWDGKSVGEMQVRGPFITGSYHEVPVTEDKFTADGWLRTGDVASVDALGFVKISDRTKDLIKSGGEWISSVDLENALMAHPAVAEAAVIAIPDEKWSERPLACVVLKAGQTRHRPRNSTPCCCRSISPNGSCPNATSSSTPCRAPRPASSGNSSCASAFRAEAAPHRLRRRPGLLRY